MAPIFLDTLHILGAACINFVFIKCCGLHVLDWSQYTQNECGLHVLDWSQYTQNECVPPCMHEGAHACTGNLCWDDFVLAYDTYFCSMCAGFLLEVKLLKHEVDLWLLSSAKVMNEWGYTYASTICPHVVDRENLKLHCSCVFCCLV